MSEKSLENFLSVIFVKISSSIINYYPLVILGTNFNSSEKIGFSSLSDVIFSNKSEFVSEITSAQIKPFQTFFLILPNLIHKSRKKEFFKNFFQSTVNWCIKALTIYRIPKI